MQYVYAYLTPLITMAVIDAVWLGVISPAFYKRHLGFIMADKPNFVAAGIFYLIFILGLAVFVVYPGWKESSSLLHVALLGALFGLVCYATYDLTNQATLKNWPHIVTIVDLVWGTVLTASVATISVILLKWLVS